MKDGAASKEVRHPAARPLHKEVLQFLLTNHAFVDAVDLRCRTPLMLAAATNLVEAVEILLLVPMLMPTTSMGTPLYT